MVQFCAVGAFQGVQQSLLHQQSKWCISARLVHFWSVGALETSAPPLKKIPTEANLRWDFHLYVFSDIYLTSTFLDVPSLILTTLMPF